MCSVTYSINVIPEEYHIRMRTTPVCNISAGGGQRHGIFCSMCINLELSTTSRVFFIEPPILMLKILLTIEKNDALRCVALLAMVDRLDWLKIQTCVFDEISDFGAGMGLPIPLQIYTLVIQHK
jgi:hypothetical protein